MPVDAPKIQVLGDLDTQKTIFDTLSRIYPGVKVTQAKEANLPKTTADFVIIDSTFFSKDKLQTIINSLPDIPVLIVIPDLGAIKNYRDLISGRREIITKNEVLGSPLIHAVHHLRERQQLHEKLTKASHRLKDLSIRDELTRLYNHKHFNEILLQEVKKATRYKRPLGLAIVDLKNFSMVNKAFGHHEGDRILAKTADILKSTIREVDIAARFGDNLFAIILPESDMAAAVRAGERLSESLSNIGSIHDKDKANISVCIGVAALSEKTQTKEELLRMALSALAESKKNGGLCASHDTGFNARELKENKQMIDHLSERFSMIGREAERKAFQSILKVLNEVPYQKKHLIAHSERVAFFAERLATKVEPINGMAHTIYRAGLLHDIGKLALDNDVLNKDSKLSAEELNLIEQHPTIGAQIVNQVPFLSNEAELILNHHERFDGNGYPSGLKGNDIPLGARIIALTEAWDIMISPQPYRPKPLSLDEALDEIKKGAGKQFDPELVDLFTSLITS